jgi:hypothetical protein
LTVADPDRGRCYLLADELDAQVRRALGVRVPQVLRSPGFEIGLYMTICVGAFAWAAMRVLRMPALHTVQAPSFSNEATLETLVRQLFDYIVATDAYIERVLLPRIGNLPFAMVLLAAMLFFLLPAGPLSRLVDWVDRSTFYWGDMCSAHDRRMQRISQVFWGVVVTLAVTIVGAIIIDRIGLLGR